MTLWQSIKKHVIYIFKEIPAISLPNGANHLPNELIDLLD